jgi:hypothetical protein
MMRPWDQVPQVRVDRAISLQPQIDRPIEVTSNKTRRAITGGGISSSRQVRGCTTSD